MRTRRLKQLKHSARIAFCFFTFLAGSSIGLSGSAQAQDGTPSRSLEIGIIVTATPEQARSVVDDLRAGKDFAVLAKEKSIDSTANDGGYLGRLSPSQLQPELRDAVASVGRDKISNVIPFSNGYAVLKILPSAPSFPDVDPKRVRALVEAGAIRTVSDVSGFGETESAFTAFQKPEGWNRDLEKICEIRKDSYADAMRQTQAFLSAASIDSDTRNYPGEIAKAHMLAAQLYSWQGDMERAILQLKQAFEIARLPSPQLALLIQQKLGTSYLHLAEMENGAYRGESTQDLFPPLPGGKPFEKTENAQMAIRYLGAYLEQQPEDYQVRWLLNVAYATLGQYPDKVPAAQLIPLSDFQSPQNIGRFKDVAPAAGTNAFLEAGGIIVDDFDNDGLLDIVASSMDACDRLHFYHNNGDGTFSDRTEQAGLADQTGGLNLVQVDYNNDGCMDILVLRGGWEFPMRKSLLRNNCNGTFTDVTQQSGLNGTVTATNSAVWADIDNDGYLDLFVANENSPSQLFRNRGDGTFEDISHAAGIDVQAFSKGVTAADYDNDGYVDFYVSNLDGPNYLYRNNHNNTFTDVAKQAGVQAPAISFSTWFFDYDNDGWPDIFVNAYPSYSVDEVIRSYAHQPYLAETVKLYRNLHNGAFEDVTAKVGLDRVFMPMGADFGDVDNDGFLDIYLGVGQPSYGAIQPHELLRNDGGKAFVDITASSGTGDLHKGHGIGFADLFRTGHEDIVANFGGAVPGDRHALRLFQNPGNDNDWINVKLVGVKSNRAAVGARITVTVENDGHGSRTICRTVGYGSSFSGNPLEQHIGLGHGARILGLDIWWPATDSHQHFTSIEKNQFVSIKEFDNDYAKLNRKPVHQPGDKPVLAAK